MKKVITPERVMTYEQRQLLRSGMDSLAPIARPFSLLFYGKLFELDPSTRALFSNDMAEQGRKLMSMLSAIVSSLDDFQPMLATLHELGRKHVEYGVQDEQYVTLNKALLWALAQALEADFDSPAREAWRSAMTTVTGAMLAGARQAHTVPPSK